MARAMVGTLEMASLVAIEQWFEAAKKKKKKTFPDGFTWSQDWHSTQPHWGFEPTKSQ